MLMKQVHLKLKSKVSTDDIMLKYLFELYQDMTIRYLSIILHIIAKLVAALVANKEKTVYRKEYCLKQ